MLIVFEGVDGSGKTTQLGMLADVLRSKIQQLGLNNPVFTNAQPSQDLRQKLHGKDPRAWMSMLYLFLKDREQTYPRLLEDIQQAKEHGGFVLLDRYLLSTLVYQGAYGGFKEKDLLDAHEGFLIVPDVSLVFNVPKSVAHERMLVRSGGLESFDRSGLWELYSLRYKQLSLVKDERLGPLRYIQGDGSVSVIFLSVVKALLDVAEEQQTFILKSLLDEHSPKDG